MDAGKISSLIHNLRPGDRDAGSRGAPTQGDAAFAARVAAAVLVDSLLHTGDAEQPSDPLATPPAPLPLRNGIVVNLSTAVVAAEAASRPGSALPREANREHSKPEAMPAPAPAQVYSLTERLIETGRSGALTSGAAPSSTLEDRRGLNTPAAPLAISPPETRADFLPFLPQQPMLVSRTDEHQSRAAAPTALDQARASERLAGLNTRGDTPAVPGRLRLDHLVIGAIVLGLALVLLL